MHKSSLVFNVSSDGFKKRWHDVSTSIREVSKAKPEDYSASHLNIALHTIWTLNASNEFRISWFFFFLGGGGEGERERERHFFLKTYPLLIIRTCECHRVQRSILSWHAIIHSHGIQQTAASSCREKKWFACSSVVEIDSCGFYISIICYDTPLL